MNESGESRRSWSTWSQAWTSMTGGLISWIARKRAPLCGADLEVVQIEAKFVCHMCLLSTCLG